jgi:hypothetical protein
MDIMPSHCCRNAKSQRELVTTTTASMRLRYVTRAVHECMELIKKESNGFQLHIFYSLENHVPYSFDGTSVYFSAADHTMTLTSNTRQI